VGDLQEIPGGITAPLGFTAAGIHAGLKRKKKDLALVVSRVPAVASAVYTRNLVQAAPLVVTRENLAREGKARAIVCNSGHANACTGQRGYEDARRMAQLVAQEVGCPPWQVVVASTGVIGVPLPMEKLEEGLRRAAALLSPEGGNEAAEAILTTDTVKKEAAATLFLGGKRITIGGMAKGSGMIHPNMATMLAFITTDARVPKELLDRIFKWAVDRTFNMVTVDGDTSTNDMAVILANGLAGNSSFTPKEEEEFSLALKWVCQKLCRMIARDGEGATRLITVEVKGAPGEREAQFIARAVVSSNLVKSAVFGADPNWGRILCAAGYSGVSFDPLKVDVYLGAPGEPLLAVALQGSYHPFDEDRARELLQREEVIICLDLNQGEGKATAWGCDLTYDYVKINASYRS